MTSQIVEDKGKSIEIADEIAMKAMRMISHELREVLGLDDPAENSYIIVHAIGNLTARMCLSLEGYRSVYGIEGMNAPAVQSWIHILTSEYLNMNQKEKEE